jgi:hypothetical protein
MSRRRRDDEDDRDESGLGKLVSEHAPFSWWILFVIGVPLALVGVPLFIYSTQTTNPAIIIPGFILMLAGAFFLFVGGIGWMLTSGLRLELFKNGIVMYSRGGSEPCAWDDIESVNFGREGWFSSDTAITLNPYKGEPVLLDTHLYGLDKVYRAVVKGTLDRMLREARAELKRDGVLDFGNGLTLDAEHLKYEKKRLPISQVHAVQVGRQVVPGTTAIRPTLFIESGGGRGFVVPLLGIVNLHVLTQLLVHHFDIRVYIDTQVVEPLEGELDGAKHGR